MSSSSHNINEDASSGTDEESIPIPPELRFAVESLKSLALNPLTQSNYLNWSTQVEEFLEATSYTKFLDPAIPTPPPFLISKEGTQIPNPRFRKFTLINKTLLGSLRSTISPPHQSLVLWQKTVAQFWTTLATHFQSHTRSRITLLQTELFTLRMRGNDLSTYIDRMRSIHNQLEAVGCHTDESQIITLILNGLPTSYRPFISAFRLKSKKYTLEAFLALLYTEELSLNTPTQPNPTDPTQALHSTLSRPLPTPTRNPNYKGNNPRPY